MIKQTVGLLTGLIFALPVWSEGDTEYQDWLKKRNQSFQQYLDEQDKAFADFLKQQWISKDVEPERKRDKSPKPKNIPKPLELPKLLPAKLPEIKPISLPIANTPQPSTPVATPIGQPPTIKPIEIGKVPTQTPIGQSPIGRQPNTNIPKPIERTPIAKSPIDKQPTPRKPVPSTPTTPIATPTPLPTPVPVPVPTPSPVESTPQKPNADQVAIEFLGQQIIVSKMTANRVITGKPNKNAIADGWLALARQNTAGVVKDLQRWRRQLNLDDWASAILTHRYAKKITQRTNDQRMLTWFLLVKQGLDTRVAYDTSNLYLLVNVAQPLYGQTFFSMEGSRYYLVDFDSKRPIRVGQVWTYKKQHGNASRPLYVNLSKSPVLQQPDAVRKLTAKVSGTELSLEAPYHSSYVDLLDYYPQMDMAHYFVADLPQATRESLIAQLKPVISGLSEAEAVSVLLNFVQLSLKYQTDQQQFKYENYLFASETLHYPYADCEDRSVLFAWLVRNLLGNDVVGMQYDGHIATAVRMNSNVAGDSINVNGKKFIVADPTYINAGLGQTMPMYKGKEAKIIQF